MPALFTSFSFTSTAILQNQQQQQQQQQQITGIQKLTTSSSSSWLAKFSSIVREIYTTRLINTIIILLLCKNVQSGAPPEPYYGTLIGPFTEFAHGIKGTVYAVDESTLFIKGFSYDGTGPKTFFWVGKTPRPSPEGYIIPYPEEYKGRDPPQLEAYNNTDIILRLPMGKRIRDIRWLSVWCQIFTVDFGEVFIPPSLDVPKPRVLPEFKRLAHGLRSSNISVLDAKTFYIPNLHYDGAGPDAYFWVGNGTEPNIMGIKVPNEMGSLEPLRGYQGEDIEIQLPGNLTVYDIDWLAVWCVQYHHNFGHVFIPKNLDVPPALGQTKIATTTTTTSTRLQNTNCRELLDGRLQVKWEIQGELVEIRLYGRIQDDQYMAFGISGFQGRSQMVGGDVTVAFYDSTTRIFRAEDYYLSALSQCDGKQGVCPDERIGGHNDIVVVTGNRKNNVTSITYRRPLQTNEPVLDRAIETDRELSIIAAIGPLNSRNEANAHLHNGLFANSKHIQINFASRMDAACKSSLYDIQDLGGPKPWPTRTISGETVIYARIGPTGGKRGYTPLTGLPSWGIAWYLNDLLIPELYVERGQTYTFVIEGGDNSVNPANYHPFYITDSSEGGYGQKTAAEQRKQTVYAGVAIDSDNYHYPTGVGRYCEWEHETVDKSEGIETFEEYMTTLNLKCEIGNPGYLNWTVPMDAPDLLYYQCYTHTNLGWKIHVVDPGQTSHRNHMPSISSNIVKLPTLLILTIFLVMLSNTISNFKYA